MGVVLAYEQDIRVLGSHGPEHEMLSDSINGLLVQSLVLFLQTTKQKVLLREVLVQ